MCVGDNITGDFFFSLDLMSIDTIMWMWDEKKKVKKRWEMPSRWLDGMGWDEEGCFSLFVCVMFRCLIFRWTHRVWTVLFSSFLVRGLHVAVCLCVHSDNNEVRIERWTIIICTIYICRNTHLELMITKVSSEGRKTTDSLFDWVCVWRNRLRIDFSLFC